MKKIIASIVIPTFNEEKDIKECLDSLRKQSYNNFEIIVIDDGSTDNTRKIVKGFKKIRLIEGQHKGPGFSRNLGAKEAWGDILVFVDADMTFDRDYLKNLVKPLLDNEKVIGTTHELEIVKNVSNIWSRCWGKIKISKEDSKKVTIFRAIRKKIFLERKGFDPKYGYADDQSLWFKYRLKPIVAKETVCYHKNPETLKGVYKQSRWIGASINFPFIDLPIVKNFIPIFGIFLSPVIIPLLTLKRCYKNKELLIFPWMLVFMTARYLGTLKGIFNNVCFKKNVR